MRIIADVYVDGPLNPSNGGPQASSMCREFLRKFFLKRLAFRKHFAVASSLFTGYNRCWISWIRWLLTKLSMRVPGYNLTQYARQSNTLKKCAVEVRLIS